MRIGEWAIEDIVAAHPDMYLEHCALMAVALMSRQSASPCEFRVECSGFSPPDLEGDTSFLLRVAWGEQSAVTATRVWLTEQPKPIIERAAVALAALAFARLIPGGQMRVADQGQRTDYWLPRLRCALEISGTGQSHGLAPRQREKTAQTLSDAWHWKCSTFGSCVNPTRGTARSAYYAPHAHTTS